MSEEGGGKIRNKKVPNPPKPYERRKSFLGKVTDTVKELISPSWLSDLVNSVKKPSAQKEDEQPMPPAQEPQYMSSLQSHQQRNRIQMRDSPQFSPPKFVPLTRNGLANLSPRSSIPVVPSLPPQPVPQQSPLTFCTQNSDVGEVSRKSQIQPNIFLPDSKSIDGNRNFLSNCTVGRSRLDSESLAGPSDASARQAPSHTDSADTSPLCNHSESMDGEEETLPVSVNRLNKSTTWTEGFVARKPRPSSRSKPGFDISLFGAPLHNNSLLGESSHESSFYPGKTTYGGASAQRKTRINVTGPYQSPFPMRQKMKVKPVNTSTSAATSSTAQRILETLEKMSTPLSEAKKIPTDDTVLRLNSSFNPTNYRPARHSIGSYLNTRRELQSSQSGPPTGKVSTPVPASISRNFQRVTVPQSQPGKSFLNEKVSTSTIQQAPRESEKTPSAVSGGGGKLKSKKFQQHLPGRRSAEDDDEEVEMPNLRTDFTLPMMGNPQFGFGSSQPTKPVVEKGDKPNAGFTFSTPIQKTPTKPADQLPSTKTVDFTFSSPLSMDNETVKPKSVTFDIEPVKVKESQAAFSPPAFKFGSPLGLQSKSPSNIGASPVLPRSSGGLSPATELKSGSVMDILGKSGESGFRNTGSTTTKINNETSNMGGFKPASELKQGSVMDVLGSPKTSSSSFGGGFQPAKELKKGSVMDVLGKSSPEASKPSLSTMFKVAAGSWECDVCSINNKADITKCVACGAKKQVESGSAPAPSSQSSLSSMFKVAEGSWTCDTCMIQNKSADTKCVACQTKKPGASGSANSPIKDSLASKFKRPTGNWECDTCLVPNNETATKCIACETPRPGLQPSSFGGLKFGGVPVNNQTGFVAQSGFKFGVSSKETSIDTKSVSSPGAGQFGLPVGPSSNSTSESSKSSAGVTVGFKFGSAEVSSGGPSVGGFKFGAASSTPNVAPTTGFKIGSLAAPKSDTVTGGFQMPTAKSSPVGDLNPNKTESPSTFKSLFGVDKSEITSGPKTDSTSGKVSNGSLSMPASSSPAVGFQFGAPTKPPPPYSAGPAFTMAKSSEETPKPTLLFNVPSPASTAAAPSLKRSHNEENGPSDAKRAPFMFNSGTTAEPAKSGGNNILFSSPASAPVPATKASIFQASTAPTSTLPTTASAPTGGFSFGMGGNSASSGGLGASSFGATAKNPPGYNFSVETNKSAVFSFGAGSGTGAATTAPPVFGSSTTSAKTSAPSAPFAFSAQPSTPASQALPTSFGSAQESTPAAFNANTSAFGSGSSMFGSTGSTPSFGASGAVPPSGFAAAATVFSTTSAGTTPAFGAATTATNANAGPTGGFNFGNQQQGFNFSAPSSAPVNNGGVFQFGAKPSEGTPAAAPQASAGFNFNASTPSSYSFGQSAPPAMPGGTGSFNIGSNNDQANSGRKIKKAVRKIRR